ncbi:hypothetical protein [Azospirillum soli]|uniref:hypothetical protein n=1 Tax=Azospirillum soli TaxID=1304799 RepID=UPI001AEA9A46|nr:hypothetical protein [Azospirillum soli]MBP2314056.1 hypothetical protein [Azospirillum soli]
MIEEICAILTATGVPTPKALNRLVFPRGSFFRRPVLPGSIFRRAIATRQKCTAF